MVDVAVLGTWGGTSLDMDPACLLDFKSCGR